MRENRPVQLEIFSSSSSRSDTENKPKALIEYLWGYEKTILILIGFLVVSIISFSLGFEKGKRNASFEQTSTNKGIQAPVQPAVKTTTIPAAKPNIQPVQRKVAAPTQAVKVVPANNPITQPLSTQAQAPIQPKLTGTGGNYTIQIASYKSKKFAEAEAERLKKNGFTTIIAPKGEYIVLYVGRYSTHNEAKLALSQLQKQDKYKGCIIRRM